MTNAPKKSASPEPEVDVHDLSKLQGRLKAIGGSMCDDWNNILANQTIKTIWHRANADAEEIKLAAPCHGRCFDRHQAKGRARGNDRCSTRRLSQRLDGMLSPRHDRRADHSKAGAKISAKRTSSRGLTRHCWKPSTGIAARGSRRSRSSTSTSTKADKPSSGMSKPRGVGSHRNQRINPMQLPIHQAPRCGARTRAREPVPVAGDAERPMPDARRNVTGSAEGK